MYLMRIGDPGAEKPVARLDDDRYVDLSDVVDDFDETFFADGGLDRLRAAGGGAGRLPVGCRGSPANGSGRRSPGRTRSSASG